MLALSINTEGVFFVLVSLLMMAGAVLAISAKNSRNAILLFLFTSLLFAGLLAMINHSTIAVIVAMLYVSTSSILLIINTIQKKNTSPSSNLGIGLFALVTFSLLCAIFIFQGHEQVIVTEAQNGYFGISEITLLLSVAFIIAITGIAFIVS